MSIKAAKEQCGYQSKPVLPTCGNCAAFTSDFVLPTWAAEPGNENLREKFDTGIYAKIEKNMRCEDFGFATKKMASCKLWREKP